jgi:hypothetical protein
VRLLAVPFDVVIAITGRNLPISSARLKKLFLDQTKFEADRISARYGFVASVPPAAQAGRDATGPARRAGEERERAARTVGAGVTRGAGARRRACSTAIH